MPLNVGRQKSKNLLDEVMPGELISLTEDGIETRGGRITIDPATLATTARGS